MSMHLRGSHDMMRTEDEGWWTSRSGLEQKLIILSTILFIVSFSLTITVIVYKNRASSGDCTTVAPPSTPETSNTSPASDSTVASSTGTESSPSPEASSTTLTTDASSTTLTTVASSTTLTTVASSTTLPPETTTKPPEPKADAPVEKSASSPLILLLKETNRVNGVLEKLSRGL